MSSNVTATSQTVQKSCWPPAFLGNGVRWLKKHSIIASVLLIIGLIGVIVLFNLNNVPSNIKFIIGGSVFGGGFLLSLPVLVEWERQTSIERRQNGSQKSQ